MHSQKHMHDGPNYEKVIAMQYALHHYSINETYFLFKIHFLYKKYCVRENYKFRTQLVIDKSFFGSNSPARVNGDLGVNVGGDLGGIHVRGVLEVSGETVVLHDEGIENISEIDVRIFITSIDTAMLVVEFNSASNGLGQSEAGGGGHMVTQFSPLFSGGVLGGQGVSRSDLWEGSHGSED